MYYKLHKIKNKIFFILIQNIIFEICTPENPMSTVGSLSLAYFSKFIKLCENISITFFII